MALTDKNIVITPNVGSASDPKIVFSGADGSTGAQNITLNVYPTNSGTLSFEGSAGQLLSITNSMTGTIYSVNDVSGIPSIEVLDTGLVKIAQYSGNVLLGSATDDGVSKLQVTGSAKVTGGLTVTGQSTNTISITSGTTGTVTIDSGTTGAISIGTNANAKTITVGNATGASGIVLNSGSTGVVANTVASGFFKVAAAGAPTVDMVQITNIGQATVTAGVSALQVNYVGGAAAVEASASRIDITPGGTTGGVWNGLRVLPTAAAATGVTYNALKFDTITSGAGTDNIIYVGTGYDNILNYNGTTVINGTGNLIAGQLSGTIPSTVLSNSSVYIGTTAVALNRATADQALTGITSITGTTTLGLYSTTTSALTIDSGTTGAINIGASANAKTITIGSTSSTAVQLPTGVTKIGQTFLVQGVAGNITFPATAGTLIGSGDSGTITTAMLASSSSTATGVTYAKMQYASAQYRVLGRITAAAGVVEELTADNIITVINQGNTAINAARLSLPSGQTAGSTTSGYLQYAGTTKTAGQLDGGTTAPTNTTRLNYDGYLYATRFYGDGSQLTGIISGATLSTVAASTTYYIGLAPNSTGAWVDGRVDTSNLYYTSGNQTLYCTNFNTSSDIRLKENVNTIDSALNTVKSMRGVGFNWKQNGQKTYGVIAQEIEAILPELVSEVDDKKSVNYNAIIGFLIQAVKELSDKVEKLENVV